MQKSFELTYEGQQILVTNSWMNGEKLHIDGKLQDENLGLSFRGTLNGVLRNHNNEVKTVKASVGGFFTISCRIFVDNQLVYPIQN
ncbi:hypothetical protein JOC54_003163 [Alkalihalobacillus xiaoxiensis]|uniref:Uncharacterized protein n=1 Tax=Shouchella xiaoxiensis TaxID=766895 RepID=A0ABS2SWG3_9BACI|nr:hypothetical protein [Shouchella xiaoxiensis]MBM7839883.1 hypothetical protein [Shouchella xiaoxiensis]